MVSRLAMVFFFDLPCTCTTRTLKYAVAACLWTTTCSTSSTTLHVHALKHIRSSSLSFVLELLPASRSFPASTNLCYRIDGGRGWQLTGQQGERIFKTFSSWSLSGTMFKWLAKANPQLSPSSSGFRTPFLPTPEAAKNDEEKRVLASAGKEIDSQVAEAAAAGATAKKRGSYHQYDGETRAKIARYACEHCQTAAMRHFISFPLFQQSAITKSTIQSMVKSMRKKAQKREMRLAECGRTPSPTPRSTVFVSEERR